MPVSEEMVRRFCAEDVDQIQGFTYKERSVIRDFRNDRHGVELWSQPHSDHAGRDSAELQVRLQFERTRAALTAALSDQVVVPKEQFDLAITLLKQNTGLLCESGNLNNYRNLSDAELGKAWVETATRTAEFLNEIEGIAAAPPSPPSPKVNADV